MLLSSAASCINLLGVESVKAISAGFVFTVCSHKKKRMNQIKKMMQRGLLDPEKDDPFSLFMASTNIRYCYYADTHKILGNTFGMCVLQVRVSNTPLIELF